MYTTIKGRYEKGRLILEEAAPAEKAEVLVTFTSVNGNGTETPAVDQGNGKTGELLTENKGVSENLNKGLPKRQFGAGKGIVLYMADDFDEPLEDMKEYME